MNIGIDLHGGDNLNDISLAINEFLKNSNQNNSTIFVFSTPENLALSSLNTDVGNLKIIYCEQIVTMHDDPAFVVRKKRNSSMVVGGKYLAEKKIDAFISAGNTGALATVGLFVVKRISGISKPAILGLIPSVNKETPVALLDLGANIEPKADELLEYAFIANKYMQVVYNIEYPKIALLNIGEEEKKGIPLYKEVYTKLKESSLNFTGNVEAREPLVTTNDIILMDGWSGNIMLKSIEGTASLFSNTLKDIYTKNLLTKLSFLPIRKNFLNFRKKLDYKDLGATPIIGINGLLLKSHGSSDKIAFINAFKKAEILYKLDIISKIQNRD